MTCIDTGYFLPVVSFCLICIDYTGGEWLLFLVSAVFADADFFRIPAPQVMQ
jgi:hypothetical protein